MFQEMNPNPNIYNRHVADRPLREYVQFEGFVPLVLSEEKDPNVKPDILGTEVPATIASNTGQIALSNLLEVDTWQS